MDLRTGQAKFKFDGFEIKFILTSILLVTRPAESWSGFTHRMRKVTRPTNAASFTEWIAYFVSTGKVTSSLHHGIFNVNVLNLGRQDHVGLIGLYGEKWNKQNDQSKKTQSPLPRTSAVYCELRGCRSSVRLKGRLERGGINHSSGHVGSVNLW